MIQACNPPDTFWALALLCQPRGVRFVFDQHDLCPEIYESRFGAAPGSSARGLRLLERATYRTADHVIVDERVVPRVALAARRRRAGRRHGRAHRPGSRPAASRPADPIVAAGGHRTSVAYLGVMGPQDGVDIVLRRDRRSRAPARPRRHRRSRSSATATARRPGRARATSSGSTTYVDVHRPRARRRDLRATCRPPTSACPPTR